MKALLKSERAILAKNKRYSTDQQVVNIAQIMQSIQALKGASIVVENASVTSEDSVLVVGDWRVADIAEQVAAAAKQRDAKVTMSLMDPRELDGNSPPKTVGEAMLHADVIFPTVYRSFSHSPEMQKALQNGARAISLVKFTMDQLMSGGLYADYERMQPHCQKMTQKFTEADEAHLTSPQGTDVTLGLQDRSGNNHDGFATEPGDFTAAINIEANIAPVEGTTEGTLVFDGSIPNLDIGVLKEDVTMEVKDGSVTKVEGGKEAQKIKRVWSDQNDPAVYNIAQLATGMNPKCTDFNGQFQNEHGVFGNVHIGIGTSSSLGGSTQAPVHFDAMISRPSLELDGETVIEEGEFTFF